MSVTPPIKVNSVREAIEHIAGRKLSDKEMELLPQLLRCKDEDAIRVLLKPQTRKGNESDCVGTNRDIAEDAA